LDIFFAAATGDYEHAAKTDCDHDSDEGPYRADAGKNTHLSERGEKSTNQDNITNKIHPCLFHNKPPVIKM